MGKALPSALHGPAYAAVRAGLTIPLVVGPRTSLEVARAIAGLYARAPFNKRRLDRASEHLRFAFPGWDDRARRDLAVRAYEHLAMLAVEVAFTPRLMSEESWPRHVELDRVAGALSTLLAGRPTVLITGHCGNWELLGYVLALLGFPVHALYRPLDMDPLDRWARRTRARRGLVLLDKFGAMRSLPGLISTGTPIAFVADQNAGDRGLFVPFFGRLASTYKSIGILAIQHGCTVVVGQARRLGWGGHDERPVEGGFAAPPATSSIRYRIEIHDLIRPEEWNGRPDPLYYLTARYRRAIEAMIRAAPEQYLWMHRIWKSRPRHEREGRPFPASLRRKLEELPWMDDAGVESVVEQSRIDGEFLQRHGLTRLP